MICEGPLPLPDFFIDHVAQLHVAQLQDIIVGIASLWLRLVHAEISWQRTLVSWYHGIVHLVVHPRSPILHLTSCLPSTSAVVGYAQGWFSTDTLPHHSGAMQCNAELHGFELVDNPGLIFYAPHHSAISRELHNPILHSYELIALTSTTAPTLHPKTSNNILLNYTSQYIVTLFSTQYTQYTVQHNNNILKVYFVYEGF